MAEKKLILDACCGGRMMWFDKNHDRALFVDIRKEDPGLVPIRPNFCVRPDEISDFRQMKYKDCQFKMVVWDPPHMLARQGTKGMLEKKYGGLDRAQWRDDLKNGFEECWRVLDVFGSLILKWNEGEIKLAEVLKLIPVEPLFGHTTGSKSKTKWVCFMKFESE